MQGEAPAAARRPTVLPRSISDISETHSLQAYASLRDHGSATDVSPLPLSQECKAFPAFGQNAGSCHYALGDLK